MSSKINMDKYKNMDKFAGYKNLDSLVKEAQDIPGIGAGSASVLNMFTGGGGSANPMNALMGGMGGLTGGDVGLAGGAATAVGGNILQGMLTQDSALVQMAEMYAFEKGGQALYNKVKSNPSELLKVAEGAVEAGATNPAAVANKPALKKLTDYVASKGTSLMDLAKKIPGSKFFTNAAATIGEKGIGKGVIQGIKTVGKKLAPKAFLAARGGKLLSGGPITLAIFGTIELANYLLGNSSKQWMSKAVDLLIEQRAVDPKDKESFLSELMNIYDKGIQAFVEEQEAAETQQQVSAYYKNREKQAFIYNNKFNSREASFTLLKLKEEEQNLLEQIELYKQAISLSGIADTALEFAGVDNIVKQIKFLINKPDVQALIKEGVDQGVKDGVIPEGKEDIVIQKIMGFINRGIEAHQAEEEAKKQQTPQQTTTSTDKANVPVNNATQNTGNLIAPNTGNSTTPNTNTTTQPPVDNSVVDINGVAYNPTNQQGPNGMVVTDAQGNKFNYNPQTRVVTPA